ncbi:MAG TPA: hypothetical protein VMU46_04015 [Burkholderiales bacterium]|nr:hypothetical protein [Burkholderiales bacterium]
MAASNAALKSRLYLAGAVILAAGLLGAVLIYATAEDAPESASSYVVVDGVAYPVAPQYSKRYVRDLERYGGKAAVLFDEINRWFDSLWQGKTLAFTVACISLAASLATFLFARGLPPDQDP